MKTTFIQKLLNCGFKVRTLLNEGPAYAYYSLFWWGYPTKVLRNKAALNPYPRLRAHILKLSGVSVGDETEIGFGTLVLGVGKKPPAVTLGARVAIAPYVVFVTSSYPDNSKLNKHPEVLPMIEKFAPIAVEDDCWIGANAVIFPNVRLGKGCIVGSGAIVRNDVSPYSIVAGAPAKCIRTLSPQEL